MGFEGSEDQTPHSSFLGQPLNSTLGTLQIAQTMNSEMNGCAIANSHIGQSPFDARGA